MKDIISKNKTLLILIICFKVDCFGIASVAYTLLNGSYMKLIKNKNCTYSPNGNMKRYQELIS